MRWWARLQALRPPPQDDRDRHAAAEARVRAEQKAREGHRVAERLRAEHQRNNFASMFRAAMRGPR